MEILIISHFLHLLENYQMVTLPALWTLGLLLLP